MSFSSKFFSVFPPPEFISLPSVGIDVSESFLRAVSLKKGKKTTELDFFEEIPIREGSIINGDVADANGLIKALSELKSKRNIDFANISISEEKSFLFETEIPKVASDSLRQAVEFKIEENVPFPVKEVLFDFNVLPVGTSPNTLITAITAIPKGVVERYLDAFLSAGIVPAQCETESRAIARSVIKKGDERVTFVVNLSENKTLMFIAHRGIVHFSSTVNIGGNLLTEALEKSLGVSKSDASALKKKMANLDEQAKNDLFSNVFNTLSALKDEIGKILLFWKGLEDKRKIVGPIERIVLCGTDATVPGFEKYLRLTTGSRVYTADVWTNIFSTDDVIPEIERNHSLGFAGAVGLAIHS